VLRAVPVGMPQADVMSDAALLRRFAASPPSARHCGAPPAQDEP
jgi:hypothetical protein